MSANRKITVRFPDLFVRFLKEVPTVNENYPSARAQSEALVCSACELSPFQARTIRLCNFSYFAAVMVPFADECRFKAICDWGNWIFPFDDMFDNGTLRSNYEQAKEVLGQLLGTIQGDFKLWTKQSPDTTVRRMVEFHTPVWNAIRSDSSQGIQNRYCRAMERYCAATLDQVRSTILHPSLSIDEVLDKRRHSVCVAPLFALVEYGHGIRLPGEILDNVIIQEIQTLGIDITLLHNDLLSYHKESLEGVPHNLVVACRTLGMTAQEAVDSIAGEVGRRLEHLEEAILRSTSLETIWYDDVARYIEGVRAIIKANLYWSFHSERLFSEEQKTRLMTTQLLDVLEVYDDIELAETGQQCPFAELQDESRALSRAHMEDYNENGEAMSTLIETCRQSEVENLADWQEIKSMQ